MNIEYEVLNIEYKVLNIEYKVLNIESEVLNIESKVLNIATNRQRYSTRFLNGWARTDKPTFMHVCSGNMCSKFHTLSFINN